MRVDLTPWVAATKKAWHNYGFDRHVLYNHDIDCQGLVGDTMHMARLWDTSRDRYASNRSVHTPLSTP